MTADSTAYIHEQLTPAATWTITHNLGHFPSVAVVDSAGSLVHGNVNYISINVVEVSFGSGFSGKAYLV
ncbi:MAG: hypothetical protein M3349_04115 [Actinomycetota bacterium]|nr:hypothetical protein [Actinomycetota bacterium]